MLSLRIVLLLFTLTPFSYKEKADQSRNEFEALGCRRLLCYYFSSLE